MLEILQIPNDRFPIDLLIFRTMGNKEVLGLVESTLVLTQAADDSLNQELAFAGPFPARGYQVYFSAPVPITGVLQPNVDLFSI